MSLTALLTVIKLFKTGYLGQTSRTFLYIFDLVLKCRRKKGGDEVVRYGQIVSPHQ